MLLLLAACTPAPSATLPSRIVAVGDLHGDTEAALAVFAMAGLVDEKGAWNGGNTWLVQTGDTTDRGPDSRGVLALLRRLGSEAEAAGGRVVPLLGNHEVMNLTGDWRYVSPEDLATYGGEAARRAAYAADGEDGRWLLGLDAVASVGGTVFCHGGVDVRWAELGVAGINAAVDAALAEALPRAAAGLRASDLQAVLGADGPLWNRAYLLDDPSVACTRLQTALASLGAERMVVGHTTQESGRVAERCGGRLWGIDTGISAHYGRNLAALEIRGSTVTALHP